MQMRELRYSDGTVRIEEREEPLPPLGEGQYRWITHPVTQAGFDAVFGKQRWGQA